MNQDIKCPYCGEWQEINHDDGYGYDEDSVHQQECYDCEQFFTFRTSISFDYYASKAVCLNGGEHDFKPTFTYPVEHTKMECKICEERRLPSKEEMENVKLERGKREAAADRRKAHSTSEAV